MQKNIALQNPYLEKQMCAQLYMHVDVCILITPTLSLRINFHSSQNQKALIFFILYGPFPYTILIIHSYHSTR